MFLKRLEISGFKSFAEKIHIDFVPGVTAIVGPNGSGKSNIIDAIRWVLGEQSAKSLRGNKMEDVIFAGSDSRKAVNFAEVVLILDNTESLFPLDYTEISVSRRVFRSGDSAYFLNGQACRLKDVLSLFMDSGLGKEAFSIISQGKVDEILNSRAEDRRNVFDEAAGVLKYKTHKQQAEHKLFETTDNLDRVLDILKEINDRLLPLEKEAAAAKTAERLGNELREAEVRLLHYDADVLEQQLAVQSAALRKDEKLHRSLAVEVVGKEADLESSRQQLQSIEKKLDELQSEFVLQTSEAEKWQGRQLLSIEKDRNTKQQLARVKAQLESAAAAQRTDEEKLAASKRRRSELQERLTAAAKEINQLTVMLNSSAKETEQQIDELKSLYIEKLNEEATIRNDLKHISERLQSEQSSTEKITVQTALLSERLALLMDEKQKQAAADERAAAELKTIKERMNHCTEQLKQTEQQLAEQQQFLQQALRKQSEMQGRARVLESLEKDFSGFFSGVKEVLHAKNKQAIDGIEGAVVELISTQPEHAKAIETALGAAAQHIITATERDARKAIGYLKARNSGRATFLPLDSIKSRELPAASRQLASGQPGFIGTAFELIRIDERYEAIARNLLGQTIIAEDLKTAAVIARTIGHRYRVVTLEGDTINAGGSLTGGGSKGQSALFSRKAELETLQQQLHRMEKSIHQANAQLSVTRSSTADFMYEQQQLEQQSEQLQQQKTAVYTALQETEMEIRSVKMELSTIETGRTDMQTAAQQLTNQQKSLQMQYDAVSEALAEISATLADLEQLAENRREQQETLQQKLHSARQQQAVLKEQQSYTENTAAELTAKLAEQEQYRAALQDERQYIENQLEGEELSPEEIAQRINGANEAKQRLERAVNEERQKRRQVAEAAGSQAQQVKELRMKEQAASERIHACKVQLSRLETQYEAVTEKLLEEYGLRLDAVSLPPVEDAAALRKTAEQCKRQLAALGPVNPNAVAEFEEVSARHQFLSAQRNDLIEAKETLQEAMSEMDQEMKSRFKATFDAVRSHFHVVFKEMFGGGEADLVLTDPADLLTTGVEIIARPPGKKLQNLRLLSGGERALTVISLLFSILQVRPVPFCILDEVEAALDEANVVRYSNYLKKVSKQTQFIVITHRKGTMEGADVLYGVTMQESGVSKLLSVKLAEEIRS